MDAYVPMNAVACDTAQVDITANLTTVLATAGEGGIVVPLQVGTPSTQIGVRCDGDHNKVELFFNDTQKKNKQIH